MVENPEAHKEEVRNMFNRIAHRYDFLNHLLSFGIDKLWRKKAIRILKEHKPEKVLDLATGTGDLAIQAVKKGIPKVQGLDISTGMLHKGKEKVKKLYLEQKISFVVGASENIPFDDQTFDAATVAFGVRNYSDLKKGLQETHRVLKPGGMHLILEFSRPGKAPMKQLYKFYSFAILPLIGRLVSNDKKAYQYLPDTVNRFPHGDDFLKIFEACGFENAKQKRLSGGIASIYFAYKAKNI